MEIDLTKISEADWKLLCCIKQISLGCWSELLDTYTIMKKASSCRGDVYQEAVAWISWYFVKVCDQSCDVIKEYIVLFDNIEEGLYSWMNKYFDWDDSCWYRKIPKAYRYVGRTWWQDLFYGMGLFAYFNNNALLLGYYCLLNRLEHASLEDIAEIWNKYHDAYQRLLIELDDLYSQSWWWHWVLRECIQELLQSLKSEYQSMLKQLKERLDTKENSIVVLKLFMEKGFYLSLFCQLWPISEREKIVQDWQLYYPEWVLVYKVQSSQELTEQEKIKWSFFWEVYFKQCLLDANDSAYLYGRLIEKILAKDSLFIIPFIKRLFGKTMNGYSIFWYQFKDWARFKKKEEVLQCVETLLSHWVYKEEFLVKLSLEKIDFSKVHWSQYKWIIHQYNQSQSPDAIKRFKIILDELSFQMRMALSFQQIRDAQIQWRSVDMILNLPISNISYANSLSLCFLTHHYLSKDAVMPLQAYMITVGKYVWVRRWEKEEVRILIKEMSVFGSEVWQQGLMYLKQDIG